MTPFERALEKTLGVEGGFSNDKADRGGATRFGITERVARANGYTGMMDQLPAEWATRIYKAQYWDTLRLDHIADVSERVAFEMFDTGVNMGIGRAGVFLQRALGALGGSEIKPDGVIGPMTMAALKAFLAHRGRDGETVLLRALNALQATRYLEICEADPTQKRFIYGWLLQRVS
ncbi:MAG: hypothetical protein IT349_19205 [Candidatus Eisenbacteria bacterium]|nr:hypothetical protein [Candidatus Eisenbacteria bacterium]